MVSAAGDKDGNELMVGAQTVICALGQRGRTDVVEALRNGAPFVRVIGDASKSFYYHKCCISGVSCSNWIFKINL